MSYQFPMLVLSVLARLTGNRTDTKKAKSIAVEAKKSAREAKQENKHAESAKAILTKTADEEHRQTFAAIAVWHFERAAKKYQSATEKLKSTFALELSKRNRKYLESKQKGFENLGAKMMSEAAEISKI